MENKNFIKNQKYTRNEIKDILGGNPMVSVATKDNCILYMCVDPEINPSFTVMDHHNYNLEKNERAYLAGRGEVIQRNAHTILNSDHTFPVFLKNSKLRKWGYLGEFKYKSHTDSLKEIKHFGKGAKNETGNIDLVIIIEQVEDNSEGGDVLAA